METYYQRVAAIKCKWGLVMGRRQLGHRTETPAAKQVRSWRMPGVPKHWDADIVKEVMVEASDFPDGAQRDGHLVCAGGWQGGLDDRCC